MKTSATNVWQLVCLVLWATITVAQPGARRPAIRFRLTEKAIKYAADQVMKPLDLNGRTFNDIRGPTWSITGIRIDHFAKPVVDAQIDTEDGVTISAQGSAVGVVAQWQYSFRWGLFRFSDSGTVTVRSTGLGFEVSAKLGANAAGQPTIEFKECTGHAGRFDITFSQSLFSLVYNIFTAPLEQAVEEKLDEAICNEAEKLIRNLNRILQQEQVRTTVANELTLDYSLTGNPSFETDYMDLPITGEFTWKTAPQRPPFQPDVIPPSSLKDKMVYIWASDHVVNSFLYATYQQNRLRFHGRLTVLGFSDPFDVSLVVTQAPTFDITPEGIHFYVQGQSMLGLGAQTNITFNVSTVVTATPFIEDHVLKAKIEDINSDTTFVSSTGFVLTNDQMNLIMQEMTERIIRPILNTIVGGGIDIPGFHEISFIRPELTLNDGNLLFASDIELSI